MQTALNPDFQHVQRNTAQTRAQFYSADSTNNKMGKLFLEHPGGRRLYACASCATVLTNKRSLVSTSFHGMSGTAYLFSTVVNVLRGDSRTTDMRTGRHIVKDVYCKRCQVTTVILHSCSFQYNTLAVRLVYNSSWLHC